MGRFSLLPQVAQISHRQGREEQHQHPDSEQVAPAKVMLNPSSLLAFCAVAFWAMVAESGALSYMVRYIATHRPWDVAS